MKEILNEWLEFSKDIVASDFAGNEQLEILRHKTQESIKAILMEPPVILQGELLPCPFCGSQAAVGGTSFESDGVYICCTNDNCHVAMGENYDRDGGDDHWYVSDKEAIALWNKRAGREPKSK